MQATRRDIIKPKVSRVPASKISTNEVFHPEIIVDKERYTSKRIPAHSV